MSFLAGILKLALLKLKQRPLMLLQILGKIVSHIGPLQHLPAGYDFAGALLEEFQLLRGVLLYLVQFLHLELNVAELLLGNVLGFLVIHEALEIEHVSLQLIFLMLLFF